MTKILVIEDEKSLRKDILEMLRFEGFDVLGAENGLVGVQQAQEHCPDLILCDIMMPELDGYGVLAELRKDPSTATIPFIFLTARTDRLDVRQGMSLGADDYLTKPFTVSELLSTVHARLDRRAVIAELSEQKLDDLRERIILALPHELRTPLTGILGFSDILVTDCQRMEPTQIADMARHINDAALRLFHLIENYLVYAQIAVYITDPRRAEALRMRSTTYPGELIEQQVIQKAQETRRENDLNLNVADVPKVQILDEYLKKIVSELVDNAFKFSEEGTPVYVTASLQDDQYAINVSDRGRGMRPDEIAAIGAYMQFDRRFYEQQGSGLGLVIAKHLAELHGGGMTIQSVPGEQTTVCITLPTN